ncbi:MAG: hypothetical protein OEZ57_06870, partial [Nitrospirota bacterium]|nr:hypothetical protein [Nitrospirota bacterium]
MHPLFHGPNSFTGHEHLSEKHNQSDTMTHTQGETHLVPERQTETEPRINVVILGAGKGGAALLESFLNLPRIHLVGIADKEATAPGIKLARRHAIPTTQDP